MNSLNHFDLDVDKTKKSNSVTASDGTNNKINQMILIASNVQTAQIYLTQLVKMIESEVEYGMVVFQYQTLHSYIQNNLHEDYREHYMNKMEEVYTSYLDQEVHDFHHEEETACMFM